MPSSARAARNCDEVIIACLFLAPLSAHHMVDINVIMSTIEFYNIYYDVSAINMGSEPPEVRCRSRKGGSHEWFRTPGALAERLSEQGRRAGQLDAVRSAAF